MGCVISKTKVVPIAAITLLTFLLVVPMVCAAPSVTTEQYSEKSAYAWYENTQDPNTAFLVNIWVYETQINVHTDVGIQRARHVDIFMFDIQHQVVVSESLELSAREFKWSMNKCVLQFTAQNLWDPENPQQVLITATWYADKPPETWHYNGPSEYMEGLYEVINSVGTYAACEITIDGQAMNIDPTLDGEAYIAKNTYNSIWTVTP